MLNRYIDNYLIINIAKRLGIKVKNLTAEYLYSLVKDKKVSYEAIKEIEPKKFQDLEYTMKLIFNHDEEQASQAHKHQLSQSMQ